ncbi:acyl carrier protein [Thiomonas sp.]|jgi:acyl carrier protein|uniref:acyl carrier protein n=1 Tax=Thiomonas sp. TaxID=2047785 RepID=UPI002639E3DA|nr:acyl carrier protein [Thiomonas sp.]
MISGCRTQPWKFSEPSISSTSPSADGPTKRLPRKCHIHPPERIATKHLAHTRSKFDGPCAPGLPELRFRPIRARNSQGKAMTQEWDEKRIIASIKEIVQSTFDIDLSSASDSTQISDSGLDSMAILDVLMSLEDLTGKKLAKIDLPKNPTLHDVAEMVLRNLQADANA